MYLVGGDDVRGAKVTVDGKVEGDVPVSVRIPPGRHEVIIEKPGFEVWKRWVDVKENQIRSFEVVLTRLEAAPGELLVTSNPSSADVRVRRVPVKPSCGST